MPHDPKVPLDPILKSRARAMRHESAPAEERLWWHLRSRRLGGWKFRRQVVLGCFIADFYCFDADLVVELDGESHGERQREDVVRSQILAREGHRVIRFWNSDVFEHLDAVLEAILLACESNSTPDAPSP